MIRIPNRILIVVLVALVFMFVMFLLQLFQPVEEVFLEGELATRKWDFDRENVEINVLKFNISENNQSINVTVNWTLGDLSLTNFSLIFRRDWGDCNHTPLEMPSFGEEKIYEIDVVDTSCDENNFTNVTGVEAFAEVYIPLLQTGLIENITIRTDDPLTDVTNLSSYFSCLGEISFGVVGDPENNTGIFINDTTKFISFINPRQNWFGTYEFNLTASCDEDVLDVSNLGKNMTFYVIVLNETTPQPATNDAPVFLDEDCDRFSFYVNNTYTMDMDDCFEDEDGPEDLDYWYENMSVENISIERLSGDRLKFTPDDDFIGEGYFYIYANDSIDEERSDRVYVEVKVRNVTNATNVTDPNNATNASQNATPTPPRITSSTSGTNFQFSTTENKTFSVTAENYDIIEWYLNNRLVKVNSDFYTAGNLSSGNYSVKAEVRKGAEVISRTWSLSVIEEEEARRGSLYIIVICGVLGILILLVVLLIIKNVIDKKEEERAKPIIRSGPRPKPKPRPGLGIRERLKRGLKFRRPKPRYALYRYPRRIR